jgi:hypothetical protein
MAIAMLQLTGRSKNSKKTLPAITNPCLHHHPMATGWVITSWSSSQETKREVKRAMIIVICTPHLPGLGLTPFHTLTVLVVNVLDNLFDEN